MLKSGGPINKSFYKNAAVDALIDKAAASGDVATFTDLYRPIRTITSSEAPLILTHYEMQNYLTNRNVTGSAITPTLSLHMETVSLGK